MEFGVRVGGVRVLGVRVLGVRVLGVRVGGVSVEGGFSEGGADDSRMAGPVAVRINYRKNTCQRGERLKPTHVTRVFSPPYHCVCVCVCVRVWPQMSLWLTCKTGTLLLVPPPPPSLSPHPLPHCPDPTRLFSVHLTIQTSQANLILCRLTILLNLC